MKKYFFLAMAAVLCVACNQNEASVPAKDKAAVKTTTAEAAKLLNQPSADVDKRLVAAGYVKIENSVADAVAERTAAPARKASNPFEEEFTDAVIETYLYNLPEQYTAFMDFKEEDTPKLDEDTKKYVEETLGGNSCIVLVVTFYVDDALVALSTNVVAPIANNINTLFTQCSDGLYSQLNGTSKVWEATVGDEKFSDHAAFTAKVAAAQAVYAQENAYSYTVDLGQLEANGFAYYNMWTNPTDEQIAQQQEESGLNVAFAMGSFNVGKKSLKGQFPTNL